MEAWNAITKESMVSNDLRNPGAVSPRAVELFYIHSCHKWEKKKVKICLSISCGLVFWCSNLYLTFKIKSLIFSIPISTNSPYSFK